MTNNTTIKLSALLFTALILLMSRSMAATMTSVQSGNYSAGSTWVGGVAPAYGDNIIIASGNTVTLDAAAATAGVVTAFYITIQAGAVLDNDIYHLQIDNAVIGNPIYTNNGTHLGTGNLLLYNNGKTSFQGSGIMYCNIVYRSYPLEMLGDCNITLNGNIQPGAGGNGPGIIEAWSGNGGSLTINGNILTDPLRGGSVINHTATITVNGNVELLGSSDSGAGSLLEIGASGIFNISGDLTLGPWSSYCQNYGQVSVGGNVLGGWDTYFIQEANGVTSFGGSIFPDGEGFLFAVESPINGPVLPNTVKFTGTIDQVIPVPMDGAYADMVIENSNAVATMATDIVVMGNLTIEPGAALTVESAGSLTLSGSLTINSDATGTGSFINNSSMTATVNRYIEGFTDAAHGWHFLSSPVASQAISAFHTPGSGSDFYKWDEITGNWINRTDEGGVLNPEFETDFVIGRGYLMANAVTGTSQFSGLLNVADVPVANLTNSTGLPYSGWHLLGNPFSSALAWNNGDWLLDNVDAVCQIWNEGNASYSVVGAGGFIPSTNGFMVHASVNNASLSIPATARTHSSTAWYKSANETTDRLTLVAHDYEGATAQPAIIGFAADATEGYDAQYDSYFLSGHAPLFYSYNGEENYALNTLPVDAMANIIPLGFVKNSGSAFTIEMTENTTGQPVYLKDELTGQVQLLNQGAYSFTSSEGDDANRFSLQFGTLGRNDMPSDESLKAWMTNGSLYIRNSEPGMVYLYDLQGRLLRSFAVNTSSIYSTTIDLNPGIYMLNMKSISGSKSIKLLTR